MSILAKRMTSFKIKDEVLSNEQESMIKERPRVIHSTYLVQGNQIPQWQCRPLPLLGCTYWHHSQLETLVEPTSKLHKIEHVLLTPWQKLDAIRTFVEPCLTYTFRSTDPTTKSLQDYRPRLISTICSVCTLPSRASTIFSPQSVLEALVLQIPVLRTTYKPSFKP